MRNAKCTAIRVFVIVLVLLLITVIYFYQNPSHPIYDIYNGPEWDHYRLGDIINGWSWENNDSHYLRDVKHKWSNSIAYLYMKHVGYPSSFKNNDLPTLRYIFSTMNEKQPTADTLVIHIRLGDVLTHKRKEEYVRDLPFYKRMHAKLKDYPEIKKVAFVAGAHLDKNKEASSKMLYDTMRVFRDYDTQLLLTHDPDKDFYYMCHSKYFMKSGGGFSNLIEAYVRKNGGVVFSEKNEGDNPHVPIR